MPSSQRRLQKLTIIAQDPSVKIKRRKPGSEKPEEVILTTQVEIPAEELAPGPRGYRVQVIDYDASTGTLYAPLEYRLLEDYQYNDPFQDEPDKVLLEDPRFHAQNVYAIIMRTLARFEYALGRRVAWSFSGHQLQVAPHAFAEANAFYSPEDRSLLFGYFPKLKSSANSKSPSDTVFTCLSHDVVVHETTHALLDGLRQRFTDPSSPDQAAFHEGFADVIALFSIFSLPKVVEMLFTKDQPYSEDGVGYKPIPLSQLTEDYLRDSVIFGLAEEVGKEIPGARSAALRRSIKLRPEKVLDPDDPTRYREEFNEPHLRGEILVAAMTNAFLKVWLRRLEGFGDQSPAARKRPLSQIKLDRQRVVEEGANVADYLLTMSIRGLDYTPPCDLQFGDFLSALITADLEIRPDDSKYHFRETLLLSFSEYGIVPTSKGFGKKAGVWEPPDAVLHYDRTRAASLSYDRDEMFRFIWENRRELGLEDEAYTRVLSVRPCTRINPDDGFALRETVAEYYQLLNIYASELKDFGIKTPSGMPKEQLVTLYGGGALIFDEFGRVKYHVRNRLLNPDRQTRRLKYLWEYGAIVSGQTALDDRSSARHFAQMHRLRFSHLSTAEIREATNNDDHKEDNQTTSGQNDEENHE